MVRHGRSLALAITIKVAPQRLSAEEYGPTVLAAVLASATADRVSGNFNGTRHCMAL